MARIEAPVIRFDPVLGFGHQLALALSQLLDLHPDAVLELLQVAGERSDALVRALVGTAECLGELRSRLLLPLGEEPLALESVLALLVGEHRARIGARTSERVAELLRASLALLCDQPVEPALGPHEVAFDVAPPSERFSEDEGSELGHTAQDQPCRGCSQLQRRPEGERDPATQRGDGARQRSALEQHGRNGPQENGHERGGHENSCSREDRLENGLCTHGRGHPTRARERARERVPSWPPRGAAGLSPAHGSACLRRSARPSRPRARSSRRSHRVLRRIVRTGVESRRCATLSRNA